MAEEQTMQTAKNPLAGYYRQPKIYIRLPSQGRFYPEGSLDVSENGEYAVYSMTAKDELMFKTPDALMNGQSTVEVIKSCVPAIKEPWRMPSIDVDAVLIAIRVATYGEGMEITAGCPECKTKNEYTVNLIKFIENYSSFEYEATVQVGALTVHIKPYSYKETTKMALKTLQQQKIFKIVNDEKISDEDKLEQFGDSFVKLTELTVDIVADSIVKISTPDGDVDDQNMIKQFINNASKDVFSAIQNHITGMKEHIELRVKDVECENCQHHWDLPITMDQTNFFAPES